MKKIISLFLIFVLTFSISTNAFAYSNEHSNLVSCTVQEFDDYTLTTLKYNIDNNIEIYTIKNYPDGSAVIDFGNNEYINIKKDGLTKSNLDVFNNIQIYEESSVKKPVFKQMLMSLSARSSNWNYLGQRKKDLFLDRILSNIAVGTITATTVAKVSAVVIAFLPDSIKKNKKALAEITAVTVTVLSTVAADKYATTKTSVVYDEWEFVYDTNVHKFEAQYYYEGTKIGDKVDWTEAVDF